MPRIKGRILFGTRMNKINKRITKYDNLSCRLIFLFLNAINKAKDNIRKGKIRRDTLSLQSRIVNAPKNDSLSIVKGETYKNWIELCFMEKTCSEIINHKNNTIEGVKDIEYKINSFSFFFDKNKKIIRRYKKSKKARK